MEPILNFCSNNPGLTFLALFFLYLMVDSVAGIFKKEKTEKKDKE
jgi:hypothetical protein